MSTLPTNLLKPGQPDPKMDPTFKLVGAPALVHFRFSNVDPPASVYVQRDDILLVNGFSTIASEVVQGEIRILQPLVPGPLQPSTPQAERANPSDQQYGQVITSTFTLPLPVAPRTLATLKTQLGEGYLLSVSVQAQLAVQRGQTYVRATLNRGGGTGLITSVAQVLVQDYVTNPNAIGWPGGRQLNPNEGPGFLQSVQVANPAAGADWIMVVPTFTRRRVSSFTAQLLTSGVAGNRNIEIIVDDGANVVWRTSVPASVIAGTTQQVSATGSNQPTGVVTTDFTALIPPGLVLPQGWRVRTITTGILGGDQWSNIWFAVEDLLDQE